MNFNREAIVLLTDIPIIKSNRLFPGNKKAITSGKFPNVIPGLVWFAKVGSTSSLFLYERLMIDHVWQFF